MNDSIWNGQDKKNRERREGVKEEEVLRKGRKEKG